jgi:hypothetical protein
MITFRHQHNIKIDGTGVDTSDYSTPQKYEQAVVRQLEKIYHSHTGQAVFHEMSRRVSHHGLTVIPYNNHKEDNAYASATDFVHATRKGGFERYAGDAKNSPYDIAAGHNVDDTGRKILGADGKPVKGQGDGSDAKILFSPTTWFHYLHKQKGHKHTSGAQPDEILLHEMIHAARDMRGVAENVKLGHLYDTEEEFFAILITNIYASELHRPHDLRSDHHGFEPLSKNQDTSAEFLPKKDWSDYRYRMVAKLVREEPGLSHRLAKVGAKFNPLRRYFQLQHQHVTKH